MCSANIAYISVFQPGFCKWLPGVPPKQVEISWNEIHIHSSMRLFVPIPLFQRFVTERIDNWIIAYIGFHEQRKHLQKASLQQKG